MATTTVNTKDSVQTWVGKTNQIAADLGNLDNLPETTDSVVDGVNQVVGAVGDLGDLITVDQSSAIAAINEIRRKAIALGIALATPIN